MTDENGKKRGRPKKDNTPEPELSSTAAAVVKSVENQLSPAEVAEKSKILIQKMDASAPIIQPATTQKVVMVTVNPMILRPDPRQFRQNSVELTPDGKWGVAVDIPDDPLLIRSASPLLLTPKGLIYVQTVLEAPYLALIEQEKKLASNDFGQDDFGEEKAAAPQKESKPEAEDEFSKTPSEDEGWGDENFGDSPAENKNVTEEKDWTGEF